MDLNQIALNIRWLFYVVFYAIFYAICSIFSGSICFLLIKVSKLVSELVIELVTEFGRLNVIHTNPPSVPYSGSGSPTVLHASTIRLTPVPQLSKKAVIYKASAMIGFYGNHLIPAWSVQKFVTYGVSQIFA